MSMTLTDTNGRSLGDSDKAVFRGKIHRIKRWQRHPWRKTMANPVLVCGARSSSQFASPITKDQGVEVNCQRCLNAKS